MNAMIVTAAEVAAWLGISTRRVKELRADGVLPGTSGAPYDLQACVLAYCTHMRPAKGRAAAGGSDAAMTFDEARIRLLNEQADAQAMKNAATRGELIPASYVLRVIETDYSRVRTRLLAIPTSNAPRLCRIKGPPEMETAIYDLIVEALEELSNPENMRELAGNEEESGGSGGPDAPVGGGDRVESKPSKRVGHRKGASRNSKADPEAGKPSRPHDPEGRG